VDPRQLRHFVALADERSFTRAAAREFIVQSGLSSSIRGLETELGTELYVKGTRPVRLTAEGDALVPAARYALEALAATYQVVNAVSGKLSGRLRMGVFQNVDHLVPISMILARFVEDHPDLELQLRQLPSLDMIQMVSSGELDCAIVSATSQHINGVAISALAEEPFDLVASASHPLVQKRAIDFSDLDGVPFIETALGFASRMLSDAAFASAGYERRIVCEANEWSMVADLVAAGLGVGLLPRGIAERGIAGASPGLAVLRVRGFDITRRIDLAVPRGQAASPATRELARRLHYAEVNAEAVGSSRGASSR
jgi:DNA-binding transcriptional LysR family regulator